jgi:hypothetical protein
VRKHCILHEGQIYRQKGEDRSIARGNGVGGDLQLCFKGHDQVISTRLDIGESAVIKA